MFLESCKDLRIKWYPACIYLYIYTRVCVHTHACVLSCFSWVQLLQPRGLYVAHQAPLSMGFPRQEYCSGLPFPPSGDLLDPGVEPRSPACPALASGFFTPEPLGQPLGRQYLPAIVLSPQHFISEAQIINTIYGCTETECPSAGQVHCRSWDRTHVCLTQACSLLTPVPGITEGLHQPELPRDNQDGNPSHYCDGCK